jgi:glycosyltransferase involved in cell wall biosynthesis
MIQNLNYGGMEKLLADLVRLADGRRFDMHVLTLEYLGRFSRDMDGFATLHRGPRMSVWSLLRPAELAKFVARLAPDLVHTHSGVWYKGARAARLGGARRVVHTEHGKPFDGKLARFLNRRAARLTDVVVAVSAPLKCHIAEQFGVPEERLTVIPNGVDAEAFHPRPPSGTLRHELGLACDQPIVGSIGRLEPVKGYDIVIKAFRLLCDRYAGPPPVLVIAGEGSARRELEALIPGLGLSGQVFVLGWRDDAQDLYAHFSCFVMGSWSEGTSVSLLESMASGVAPVVTRVGGNLDVLGPDLGHLAVPAGDVGALADGMARLLCDGVATSVGAAARRRVMQAYRIEATVAAYDRLYTAVTAGD